jgi:hypothetical protein
MPAPNTQAVDTAIEKVRFAVVLMGGVSLAISLKSVVQAGRCMAVFLEQRRPCSSSSGYRYPRMFFRRLWDLECGIGLQRKKR